MSDRAIGRPLRRSVRTRAGDRCEYCHLPRAFSPLPFHVDHIVARKHRGRTTAANLAYCCSSCNLHKGSDLTSIDPRTERLTRLFDPRRDHWATHFRWAGDRSVGRTGIGRTTVAVLDVNARDKRSLRSALLRAGLM